MVNLVHNTTSLKGYWGPRTSSINWCESDYIHSYYVAELFNTFSNLFYVFCAVYAYIALQQFYKSSKAEKLWRFYVCCAGVAAVGIGSFLFHCCLTKFTQALDEIAMNVGILCLAFCGMNMDDYQHQSREYEQIRKLPDGPQKSLRSKLYALLDPIGFASKNAVFSLVALTVVLVTLLAVYDIHNPTTFQALFAACFLGVVLLSFKRSHYHSHQFINPENNAHNISVVRSHMRQKKTFLYYMVAVAASGYTSWLIDNATCPRFEFVKLHSLWHILTSFACYLLGLFVTFSYYCDKYDDWQFEMCKKPSERAAWINPKECPALMEVNWLLGFFPTVCHKVDVAGKQKDI